MAAPFLLCCATSVAQAQVYVGTTPFYITDNTYSQSDVIAGYVGHPNPVRIVQEAGSASTLEAYQTSAIYMEAGNTIGIFTYNNSLANVSGNANLAGLIARNSSTITATQASIADVTMLDTTTGSFSNNLSVSETFYAQGSSKSTINGAIISTLRASNSATVNIGGGIFGEVYLSDNATVNMSGGTYAANTIYLLTGTDTLNITGTSANITNPIFYTNYNGYSGTLYDFMATFTSGTTSSHIFIETGSQGSVTFNKNIINLPSAAPEPSALSLVCLAVFPIWRRVRHRR